MKREVTVYPDNLDPSTTSSCSHGACDGSGWLEVTADERTKQGEIRQVARMARCECQKAELRRQKLDRLFPSALRACTFAGFDASTAPDQFAQAKAWAEGFNPMAQSLLLYGLDKGVGKTHLAASIGNYLLDRTELMFAVVPDIFGRIFDGRRGDEAEILAEMSDVPLLILDDLGQAEEGDPEWKLAEKRQFYFRLLNHREQNRLPVIVTSNLHRMEQFRFAMGDAACSRLFGMVKANKVKFQGIPDYRLVGALL